MYELEKAKNESVTLKCNGKYIHSKYNPEKEAEQFVKNNMELLKKDKVLVYGIGLGYHIDKILDNSDSIIYIFEWNEELVKYCKKINQDIFKNEKIKVIEKNNKEFYKLLSSVLSQTKDLIIHKPSLETIKEENNDLYNLLNDFTIKKQLSEINKKNSYKFEDNYKFNINTRHSEISEFIKRMKNCTKPILITAAGPSLDDDLELVKIHRNKFIIFTVGSALRTVMENHIVPDAIFLIDGDKKIRNQFVGFEDINVPLCFSAYASKEAIEIYNGPKYIFNDKESNLEIKTGGTVAVAALDIATKCRPKEIIFLGQDLALIDGKNHTKSYDKMHLDKKASQYKLIDIQGVDGSMVKTIQSYILFKNSIEKIIDCNNSIEFINCSRGALIRGTKSSTVKLYIKQNYVDIDKNKIEK